MNEYWGDFINMRREETPSKTEYFPEFFESMARRRLANPKFRLQMASGRRFGRAAFSKSLNRAFKHVAQQTAEDLTFENETRTQK